MRLAWWKYILWNLLIAGFLPVFLLCAIIPSQRRRYHVWGSSPLISNKYWSKAVRKAGYDSFTYMIGHFPINDRSDFDRYFEDAAPRILPKPLRVGVGACMALILVLRQARVVHVSFDGFALGSTIFWRIEAPLLKIAGVKIIAMPYGGDFYQYSAVIDTSLRHGLLASYPQ